MAVLKAIVDDPAECRFRLLPVAQFPVGEVEAVQDAELISRRRGQGAGIEIERVPVTAGIVGIDGFGDLR